MARMIKKLYDIEYNGVKAGSLGAYALERPDIPSPVKNVTTYTVPGRDGVLTQWDGSYAPITIELRIGFHAKENLWMEKCREIRTWLLSEGNRILRLGDDSGYFYRVSDVVFHSLRHTSVTYKLKLNGGDVKAVQGDSGHAQVDMVVRNNPYDICHPTIIITSTYDEDCFIRINGNFMWATSGQDLIIDTDRMAAYTSQGVSMNSQVTGEYDGLYLKPGLNEIQTKWHFDYRIIPNWRRL